MLEANGNQALNLKPSSSILNGSAYLENERLCVTESQKEKAPAL